MGCWKWIFGEEWAQFAVEREREEEWKVGLLTLLAVGLYCLWEKIEEDEKLLA